MIHDDQVALDDDEAEVTLGPLAPDTLAVRMYAGLPHWTRELLKSLRMIRHGQLRDSAASRKPLKICTKDRPGIVHDITRCFAARDIQISSLRVFAAPPGGPYTFFDLEYEVKNPEHQEYLLRELRRVPNVIDIKNT
jgi:glycine cleavage system regulatory protein